MMKGFSDRMLRGRGAAAVVAMMGALAASHGTAEAQQSARAAIRVGAEVVQSATVRGINDLNFGDIVAQNATTTTKDVSRSDPNAGMFEVTGPAGQAVQVTFTAPANLRRVGGGSLPVSLTVYGSPTQAGADGAEQVLSRGTFTLDGGRYFLFVAGRITVRGIGTNPAGTYTGEFELSITHTTI